MSCAILVFRNPMLLISDILTANGCRRGNLARYTRGSMPKSSVKRYGEVGHATRNDNDDVCVGVVE
jgi:hypothetical protein